MKRMIDPTKIGGKLPQATETELGGIKAVDKTEDMTQPIGIDNNGFCWTKAGGGAGGGATLIFKGDVQRHTFTTEEQAKLSDKTFLIVTFSTEMGETNKLITCIVKLGTNQTQQVPIFEDSTKTDTNSINFLTFYQITARTDLIAINCSYIFFSHDESTKSYRWSVNSGSTPYIKSIYAI